MKKESLDIPDVSAANGAGQTAGLRVNHAGARHIQSVGRALDILEALAIERDGLTLSELAGRVALNPSTCHHLIATLVSRGYLVHLGRSRGYALAQKLHELVRLADQEADPAELLKHDLRKLGERLGHGVQLAVLSETSLLTKLRYPGPDQSLNEPDEITKMTALHATATGKAILAWIPDTELVRIISSNGLNAYTDNTITSLSGLVEELRLVRRRGYAIDNEEMKDGLICMGVALREVGGAVIASFSVTFPAELATEEYRSNLSRSLITASHDFSNTLLKHSH
ncbi:IclR family transcriptional regulator [Candidatus Halocynthiibacter alkanivorans]|uniref:IclR family transcriptional regulator n=1 Tax=Candidatus Halocynthiibacter alkanivorans TaxID=2267619 RepID=UPI000DF17F91|nr:IclR family transcriptional regulator [Candidatus Halocynthiibacter alkanivorans]